MRLQALEAAKTPAKQREFCGHCNKKFSSKKALDNHLQSRRHRDALLRGDMEVSTVGSSSDASAGAEEEVDLDTELETRMDRLLKRLDGGWGGVFDWSVQGSAEEVLSYAANEHGFFVPFVENLCDHQGLVRYLAEKTGVGYACVKCDKGFEGFEAVRKHMKDLGHCAMVEDEGKWMDEYGEYYVFSEEEVGVGVENGENGEEGEEEMEMETATALVVGNKVLGHRQFVRYYKQGVGRGVEGRECVLANQGRELRVGAWGGWKTKREMRISKMACRQQHGFDLRVGMQNYYTRKTAFKQAMAVFNSGYRA